MMQFSNKQNNIDHRKCTYLNVVFSNYSKKGFYIFKIIIVKENKILILKLKIQQLPLLGFMIYDFIVNMKKKLIYYNPDIIRFD